jgi:hypothetical protein
MVEAVEKRLMFATMRHVMLIVYKMARCSYKEDYPDGAHTRQSPFSTNLRGFQRLMLTPDSLSLASWYLLRKYDHHEQTSGGR